jgi:triosephosphate isomerase
MAPQPLIAGNWKMNGTSASLPEIAAVRDALGAGAGVGAGARVSAEVLVCPPATLLRPAADLCAGSALRLGGQDCHPEPSGAYTGSLSAEMLADAGASYVILGHSERRIGLGETSALVRAKVAAGLRAGLSVILCVGETAAERAAGAALAVIDAQLAESLPSEVPAERIVVAYEPVWAIGTGLIPTLADVAAAHALIRDGLGPPLGAGAARVRILYGGSVNPGNAATLLAVPHVDGALVGGASLKAADFLKIVAASAQMA